MLKQSLKDRNLKKLDISLAHSSIDSSCVRNMFSTPFTNTLETVKINLGSTDVSSKDIEYVLSLIPNGVKELEIHLDSIKFSEGFGIWFAYQLNRFTLL